MSEASVSDKDPLVGRVINDRFEILEMIARGGMGRVYKAQQSPLGRTVALKVLDPRYQGEEDPEFQARFFLEASTAAKLSHPNTVTVFDYGKTSDDIYFIVMEFVEGDTLSQLVKRGGPVEPLKAIHIAIQIARSVREAHGLGVIHRDLKPANVLITTHADEDAFVKVLDFGLVKNVEENQELTQQGLFMGSPKYMSPEQIQGDDVDARTDIYSLGVVLYNMLTGGVPFDRSTQVQTLMAHIKDEVPDMVRPDGEAVPEEIAQVVLKCLRKDPDERFGSMNDVILALKQASGVLGAPMSSSHSISVSGEYELSGVRSSGTPSGGVRRGVALSHPPEVVGVPTPSASMSGIDLPPLPEEQAPSGGKGKWFALVLLLALGGGAAFYFLSQPQEPAPVAQADPTPETETATEAATGTDTATETDSESETTEEVAPPRRVEVVLTSEPAGAEVFVGERSYGTTPASVVWVGDAAAEGREVSFRFELEGHDSTTITRTITDTVLRVQGELPRTRRVVRRWMGMGMASGSTSEMAGSGDPVVVDENYRDNPY